MACAANYAWADRQMIVHLAQEALLRALAIAPRDLGLRLVHDVAHNIAKLEERQVDGATRTLCVHRKGATRAFGPGHPKVPAAYRCVERVVGVMDRAGISPRVVRLRPLGVVKG